jgi:hypothetical protein
MGFWRLQPFTRMLLVAVWVGGPVAAVDALAWFGFCGGDAAAIQPRATPRR